MGIDRHLRSVRPLQSLQRGMRNNLVAAQLSRLPSAIPALDRQHHSCQISRATKQVTIPVANNPAPPKIAKFVNADFKGNAGSSAGFGKNERPCLLVKHRRGFPAAGLFEARGLREDPRYFAEREVRFFEEMLHGKRSGLGQRCPVDQRKMQLAIRPAACR